MQYLWADLSWPPYLYLIDPPSPHLEALGLANLTWPKLNCFFITPYLLFPIQAGCPRSCYTIWICLSCRLINRTTVKHRKLLYNIRRLIIPINFLVILSGIPQLRGCPLVLSTVKAHPSLPLPSLVVSPFPSLFLLFSLVSTHFLVLRWLPCRCVLIL